MEAKSDNAIKAAKIMELRGITGAGVMECKKYLVAAEGDLEKAVKLLRAAGGARARKKASRAASEGVIEFARAEQNVYVLAEVNCETDFVARESAFLKFASQVGRCALDGSYHDCQALAKAPVNGGTLEDARLELIAKVGENINVRRFVKMVRAGDMVDVYIHGGRIGVLVDIEGGNKELAHDLAMHIAAYSPQFLAAEQVSKVVIDNEREALREQAVKSGKPPAIVEKMVVGRMRKFLDEITLLGQPFIKDPSVSVRDVLAKHGAKALAYQRLEVGEGLAKVSVDFVGEVMSELREHNG